MGEAREARMERGCIRVVVGGGGAGGRGGGSIIEKNGRGRGGRGGSVGRKGDSTQRHGVTRFLGHRVVSVPRGAPCARMKEG